MTHHRPQRTYCFSALIASFLLATCPPANAKTNPVEAVVNNNYVLADSRPWCIGRFVFDRPARSEVGYEKYEFWGDKIDITHNVTSGTFRHKVDARENELRGKKRTVFLPLTDEMMINGDNGLRETNASWLEEVLSPTPGSRLFIYKEFGNRADAAFHSEGYVLAGTTMLTTKSLVRYDGIQKFVRLTTNEYQNITYRDNWSVPTERGFCINGALIGGPSRNSEVAEQTISLLPGKPTFLVIKMRDAVDADQQFSLLKTLPDLRQGLQERGYSHNVCILRKGKRQLGSMNAEEVLFSIKDGKTQVFQFYLQAPGNPDTTAQPHTEIQLMLGAELSDADKDSGMKPEDMSSPVDEAGAIQAWDTLLNSMRLRPGAM
jgi:Tle cognate immunity protein 4 N-terminal domain/Tle cognate immunity protein 4 C-terminal domain